ncbi:hypothetical protein AB0J14_23130 [Micromonospora arborensis]|uniref:hypothetical protein n=1 Tax=Micromonospora arborensis TaxID=2116518 RepID=UPI0033D9D589
MTTGRASGLSTTQGYYWHAYLLGDRSLVRRLQPRAFLDRRALGGVLLGMFSVAVRWLSPDQHNPAEIRLFAERVTKEWSALLDAAAATEHTHAAHGVTAEEVSRAIRGELGEAAGDEDAGPARPGLPELAVVSTAVRDLELKPGDIDRMISSAEGLARQWGINLVAYRPGFILRWRFEMAELRRYGYPARKRWSAERSGAFVVCLRGDSTV